MHKKSGLLNKERKEKQIYWAFKRARLELKSLDVESQFERILLGLDSTGIRMMAMEDAFGQRTEVHFENTQKNQPADAELFNFEPPEGADLVGVAVLPD